MEKDTDPNSPLNDAKNGGPSGLLDRPSAQAENPNVLVDPNLFRMAGWEILENPGDKKAQLEAPRPEESGQEAASRNRAKSSLRLKYEAEVNLIRRKLGDLDQIRETLGLTQRKMCQLLLVDPSAWTRWTRQEEDAPPHVYRMLQWYLALEEKYPALDVNFWLSTVSRGERPSADVEAQDLKLKALTESFAQVTHEVESLKTELIAAASASGPSHELKAQLETQAKELQNKFEERWNRLKVRERWLILWLSLFAAGVAVGLALSRI